MRETFLTEFQSGNIKDMPVEKFCYNSSKVVNEATNVWEVLATVDEATESSKNSRPKFPHAQSLNSDDMDTSANYSADAENSR